MLIRRSQSRLSSLVIAVLVICVGLSMGCSDGGTLEYETMMNKEDSVDVTPCESQLTLEDVSSNSDTNLIDGISSWQISFTQTSRDESDLKHGGPYVPPASLEMLTWDADVVVRADLISTHPVVLRSGTEQYTPHMIFTLEVLEYLKGDGPSRICASLRLSYNHSDIQNAIDDIDWFKGINPGWSGSESIVFLTEFDYQAHPLAFPKWMSPKSPFETVGGNQWFELTGYQSRPAATPPYSLDQYGHYPIFFFDDAKGNPTWVPATGFYTVGDGVQTENGPTYISLSEDVENKTVVVSELRDLVEEQKELIEQGEGIEGFRECVSIKFYEESRVRDIGHYEFTHEPITLLYADPLSVGTWLLWIAEPESKSEYYGTWVAGPNPDRFTTEIIDDDQDSTTGYGVAIKNVQELGTGEYPLTLNWQLSIWSPCNYRSPDLSYTDFKLIVYPYQEILLEAEFIPASFSYPYKESTELGFNHGDGGMLYPTELATVFEQDPIRLLLWESGELILFLDQDIQIFDRALEFLDTEGKVLMSLDFASIVKEEERQRGIYVWHVPEQPWDAGDELRVRIR